MFISDRNIIFLDPFAGSFGRVIWHFNRILKMYVGLTKILYFSILNDTFLVLNVVLVEWPCTKNEQENVWIILINCLVKSSYFEPKVVNLNGVNFMSA